MERIEDAVAAVYEEMRAAGRLTAADPGLRRSA
jgi:hypothetical protein